MTQRLVTEPEHSLVHQELFNRNYLELPNLVQDEMLNKITRKSVLFAPKTKKNAECIGLGGLMNNHNYGRQ